MQFHLKRIWLMRLITCHRRRGNMAIVQLSAIFAKIRRITGSSDVLQLPDFATNDPNSVGLADYVNSFYLYDFPAQFRA